MQRKWIAWLKTLGLVFLVAFGINLLFVGANMLSSYDRVLGNSFHRAVLFTVAYVIVLLWQQRDHTAPFLWGPRGLSLETKSNPKLGILFLSHCSL